MSRKVVDGWFDAFRNRDLSKLELAEDFVHSSPFGEIRGRISKIYSYYHVGEKPVLHDA